MAGILEQFPDLSSLLNSRSLLTTDLRNVAAPIPLDPSSLTTNLTAGLDALGNAVPDNPQQLIAPMQTALTAIAGAFPKDSIPGVQELSDGLSRALAVIEPVREILSSENGLRSLQDIVFERAGDPNVFINSVVAELTKAIPNDSVEVLLTFINTLRDFEASIPSDPDAIARFLARSFLGMPLDLLSAPLGLVKGLHGQIDALVDPSTLNSLTLNVRNAAEQLVSVRTLVKNLNPADAASYQAIANALNGVQTEMTTIQGRLTTLASGFQSGLAAIDVKTFSSGLQAKLQDVPEVRVAQIEDFIALVRGPLKQLQQRLDQLSPEQVAQAFEGGNQFLASVIADRGFSEVREAMLQPFREVGSAISGLNLERVRQAVADALGKIRDAINQVAGAIESFKNDIKKVIDNIGSVLDTVRLAGTEVEKAIRALVTQVQNSLNALSMADFGNQVEQLIARLGTLLNDFMATIRPAVEALNAFRDELEKIDLRRSAEPALDAIKTVTAILEKLDLSLVGGDQAAELRRKLDALAEIDLGPTRQTLIDTYHEAVPREAFQELAEKFEALAAKMSEYSPGSLLDPLLPAFEQLKGSLHDFDPGALLQPVVSRLAAAQVTLDSISPATLVAPLAQSFSELTGALDDLAPSKLLSPLGDVFQEFMKLFEKINIVPVLDDLENMFVQWLEKGLTELQQSAKGFGSASGLKSYLDGINQTPGPPDFGFMIGDILRPIEDLFNKIMSLLDRVPDEQLLAAFRVLQSQLVDGLQAVNPALLPGDVNSRLRQRVAGFDFLHNFDVLGSLHTPYSDVVLEFDAIDSVRIPAQFRQNYNELAALIAAVNPARLVSPLRDQFRGLNGSIRSFTASFDSRGLSPVFGPVKERLDALVPFYLHGDLSLDVIKAQLQQLNPGRLADELNEDLDNLLVGVAKFGDTLVEQLPKLAETLKNGTISFFPEIVKEAFNSVYEPLKTQIGALDPTSIIAELENTIFNPIKATLDSVNPVVIFADVGINGRFDQFKATIDTLVNSLRTVQTATSSFWRELLETLDRFDPESLKAHADKAFGPAQDFILNLDLAGTLTALDQALTRIGDDLDKILKDAEVALEDMADAIPD